MAIYIPPTYSGILVPTGVPQFGFPEDKNEPSYFDLGLSAATAQPLAPVVGTTSWYDAWCLDVNASISFNTNTVLTLYSSYERSILVNAPGLAIMGSQAATNTLADKLDNINWLLNVYNGQAPYGRADVQVAIWTLLGQPTPTNPNSPANIYGYTQANVDSLVNMANTLGEGYVPGQGGTIGIVLTSTQGGAQTQPLIIETRSASLGDYVWEDTNANGIQEGNEQGIAGVAVSLVRDLDKSGTITADEILATTTTNSAGQYIFTGLTPGLDYQVQFIQPAGYSGVSPVGAAGSTTANDSNGLLTSVVVLAPGEHNPTLDSGFYKPAVTASLGDRLWVDTNSDGLQNDGATGLSGQVVKLLGGGADGVLGTADDTVTQTTTAADGYYRFDGLTPGTQYQVMFTAPSGYGFTTQDAVGNTNDAQDSDVNPGTGKTQVVTLAPGEHNPTLDAGLVVAKPGISLVKSVVGATTVVVNTPVTFSYTVGNSGQVPLSNVVLKDDNATTNYTGDDFYPTPVLAGSYNVGDLNQDNKLDVNEVWNYTATVMPPVKSTIATSSKATPIDSGVLSYTTLANGDIRVDFRQSTKINDNTYGTGSAWTNGHTHTFSELTGTDKAGFLVTFSDGSTLAQFYQDYASASTTNSGGDGYTSYSGYESLGFAGGDGSWVAGSTTAKAWLSNFDSTLETNLNRSGYTGYATNSPLASDAKYAGWDAVDGYSFTISAAAFTSTGKSFGGVTVFDQYNSPNKVSSTYSYTPATLYGTSTNTAVVTGLYGSTQVSATDDATITVTPPPPPGTKFYVVDSCDDKVYGYAGSGDSTKSFSVSNYNSTGITGDAAGTKLWVLDDNKTVKVYSTSGTALGNWTASGLSSSPEGIALDNQSLWMVDSYSEKVYWYQNAALNTSGTDTPEKTFQLPSTITTPTGITTDGSYVWVVDDGTNSVYRYTITRDAAGVPTGLTSGQSWKLDKANTWPTGITVDPTGASKSLWVVDAGTYKVYEYANGKTMASGSAAIALTSFDLPNCSSPDDIFDPDIGTLMQQPESSLLALLQPNAETTGPMFDTGLPATTHDASVDLVGTWQAPHGLLFAEA